MPTFKTEHGDIYFEHHGARANPRVLLIHGIGCQLVQWPESMIKGLVDEGLCVVTFDNRDAGLSFEHADEPPPLEKIMALAAHLQSDTDDPPPLTPPYSLADMAKDAVALLDHLGQSGAHVIGVSMGGMVAQRMAIHHPERVHSLTSIMSTTGDSSLPPASPEAMTSLLTPPESDDPEVIINANRAHSRILGGPHYDSVEVGMGRYVRTAFERSFRPHGFLRQLSAIVADGSRREDLQSVRAPTLVLHGTKDPLLTVEAGRDTAESIPGARIVEFEHMGHDLPEPLIPHMVEAIAEHIAANPMRR